MNGEKAVYFGSEKYFSLREASKSFNYHRDYISQLCRSKNLNCRQFGNQWLVEEKSLINYKSRKSENGNKNIKNEKWPIKSEIAVKDEWDNILYHIPRITYHIPDTRDTKYQILNTSPWNPYESFLFKFLTRATIIFLIAGLVFQNPQGAFAKLSEAKKIAKNKIANTAREMKNISANIGESIAGDFSVVAIETRPNLFSIAADTRNTAREMKNIYVNIGENIISGDFSASVAEVGRGFFSGISEKLASLTSSFFQDISEGVKAIGGGMKDVFVSLPTKISERVFRQKISKTEDKKIEATKPIVQTTEQAPKEDDLASLRREIEILKTSGLKVEKVIEKPTIVERTIQQFFSEVTKKDLDTQLNQLNNKILSQYAELKNLIAERTQANFNAIALSQRINNLGNVTIASPTITSPTISGSGSISGSTLSISETASVSGAVTFGADLNADNGTLYVDSSNNRVGVGTTSPQYVLDVDGTMRVTSLVAASQTIGGNLGVTGNLTVSGLANLSANASTTQLSSLDGLYIGRTSTTTIRGDNLSSTIPYASSTYSSFATASTTNLVVSSAATLNNLTASRLISLDGSKNIASVANLASWVAGTANQLTVSDDGDGSITLSLPSLVSLTQASSTRFSVFDTLYVGGTATTTITSSAVNIPTGGTYQINGTNVLSGSILGSGVTGSSLTSLGTISTGVWQGTAIGVDYGGTNITSFTPGDIVYASGATTLSRVASSTGGTILQTSFTTGAPSWVATSTLGIALTNTTGTLAVARGGTGLTTFGGTNTILYTTAADALASIVTANSGVLVTSGAGAPSIATDIPTAVTIGGQYVYRVGGTDVAVADGGTGFSTTPTYGQLLVGNSASGYTLSATSTLGIAISDTTGALTVDRGGTNITSFTPGDIVYASGATTLSRVASSTGGTILQTSFTTGAPSWVATSSLGIALTNTTGTLAVARGGTGLTTFGGTNPILYTAAADALASIVTANSGVLVTSGAGAPSIATDIPTAVTIGGQYVYRVGGTDVAVADGGTGFSTTPTYGQLLVGNSASGYTLSATSTLGIAISDTTGALTVDRGGTNITSFTPGDIVYASGATTLSRVASSTGGTILQNSFTTGAPSWVATSTLGIALTNTTGTLAVARGGTGLTTFGGTNTILYTTAADALASNTNFIF